MYCACGCGEITKICGYTSVRRGLVKGERNRFVTGHNRRGVPMSDDHKAKIGLANSGKTGQMNGVWKGGRATQNGYIYVLVGHDHPMARGPEGRVAEHRLVMSEHIGRPLLTEEHVHHIDRDRSNNAIDNLVLFANASEHMRHHQELLRAEREARAA